MKEKVKEVWFSFKVPQEDKDNALAIAREGNSDLSKELRKLVKAIASRKVTA